MGYFFFAGVQVFAVVLVRARYGLSQTTASAVLGVVGVGAAVGAIGGGRLADRLLVRGRLTARVSVAIAGMKRSCPADVAAPNRPMTRARCERNHRTAIVAPSTLPTAPVPIPISTPQMRKNRASIAGPPSPL